MAIPPFEFVTLAYDPESLRRARAMARSLRRHERTARITLLAGLTVAERPAEFDGLVEVSQPEPFSFEYRFFNKLLALARHAPAERNFFLDDDVLVLAPLTPVIEDHFAGRPFAFHSERLSADSPFPGTNHVDPRAVAAELGVDSVVDPYGGGHLYFERPACQSFFREAIDLVLHEPERYRRLSGDGFLSDEVALAIVANRHGLEMPHLGGWIDPLDRVRADAVELDLAHRTYRLPPRDRGSDHSTALLHFCADGKRSRTYLRAVEALLAEGDPTARNGGRASFWRRDPTDGR